MAMLAVAAPATAMQAGQANGPMAGSALDDGEPEISSLQRNGMTLSDAVEQVRRQYGGRIVKAVTEVKGKQEVHVITVLTDEGTVKTVRIQGRRRD
jgi:hypothetical protein